MGFMFVLLCGGDLSFDPQVLPLENPPRGLRFTSMGRFGFHSERGDMTIFPRKVARQQRRLER